MHFAGALMWVGMGYCGVEEEWGRFVRGFYKRAD